MSFARTTALVIGLGVSLAQVGCEKPIGAEETIPREIDIRADDHAFSPSRIVAGPAEPLAIALTNDDTEAHAIAFDLPAGEQRLSELAPGRTATLTFRAPEQTGDYSYYCPIDDHRHQGMAGTLAVLARPRVRLVELVSGLSAPLALVFPDDGSERWFIVDQIGLVFVVRGGEREPQPLLDLRDRMVELNDVYDERGLLGLALHPEFADNGRLYVFYNAPLRKGGPEGYNSTLTLSEFRISHENPDRVDPASERVLLTIDKPQFNHNGGTLAFGPDDLLYISVGDGGGSDDKGMGHPDIGNGQSRDTLLGKILRIDVDGARPYAVPDDNPFVGKPGADEIYAYGFRNPYRFSFDQGEGHRLFVGDAGEHRWEEVSIVERGQNMGWNIREGVHCFDRDHPLKEPASCPRVGADGEPLVPPVIEFANAKNGGPGVVIIGGHVYRGSALPELAGRYVFGAWTALEATPSGVLFYAVPHAGGELWSIQRIDAAGRDDGDIGHFLRSFAQDPSGELYVLASDRPGPTGDTGRVFKLQAQP
ncbi:PQQ-dependent sugar dehydrogenase [Nannocystis sp. SCPEA4]|uniref:PQQ-dependent sugar dehydrogenase n=1 Tax=Nannocystis sp. SCPEA4 TaxID=2996787 RepID=UPI00226F2DE8|nr:PQQ-dependent sugar dehydrogenase [Nannocystis sp. SCPEA4]MCY1060925.1 PQQ-dependent sugar dehydrogenase [Nannocystis sp. SCPEA4]